MNDKFLEKDGSFLLKLARESISSRLENREGSDFPEDRIPVGILTEKRGVFVTLYKQGSLRGCIGNIEPVKTVFDGVKENAGHAAFEDSRFAPLSAEELKNIHIEISILTDPEELEYSGQEELAAKLVPGIDGVIIGKGYKSATFLPQVWDQFDSPESFLTGLCIKAGLLPDEWKKGDLKVRTYKVQSFEEAG